MGFGVGIFLVALGAILAFAVHASVSGLDLAVVGWILMGAGVLGIVLELAVFAPRRRVTTYAEHPLPAHAVVRRDVY
jgi:hypothetical protein